MTGQEKTETLNDLFEGWQKLFNDIKRDHPSWSDEQINRMASDVTYRKLFGKVG